MTRIRNWLMGFAIGSGISAALVMLFAPQTASEIRRLLRESYTEVMQEAKAASIARRAELEAEFDRMRQQ